MALPGPIHRLSASLSLELPGRNGFGTLMISHEFHTNVVVCFSKGIHTYQILVLFNVTLTLR
jgi:hypothetical protein